MNARPRVSTWFQDNSTLVLLIAPLLVLAVLTQLFAGTLLSRIVTVLFINLILVCGLQVFMGNSGILSFSHIGFMGIGAYSSVLLSMTPQAKKFTLPDLYPILQTIHLPFLVAVFLGACFAALVAAVVIYPLMRLSDAAAVISMFALLVIIQVILVHWSVVTNGPRTLFGVDFYTTLWVAVAFGVLAVIVAYYFKRSDLGLKLRASRDDRYAAGSIGINMVNVRYLSFILSAFMAGFGGALWAHFITSFSPYAFYLSETFAILTMLVVGGPGGVSGAVIGTVVVTFVHEGLRQIENNVNLSGGNLVGFTEVFLATALIIILIARPGGIMGGREVRWRGRGPGNEAGLKDAALPAPQPGHTGD
ncbi:MAG TPA: branched-chain amino acid ABC transporter permease [Anaerolineales bacterium]|nr:branched-chain amino acid ABC transporter permease [Anaerolineales bacterium]